MTFYLFSLIYWYVNTGATRYGRGQHKTGSFGDDMLRPSPNHGTQRLPNDDDDDDDDRYVCVYVFSMCMYFYISTFSIFNVFLSFAL